MVPSYNSYVYSFQQKESCTSEGVFISSPPSATYMHQRIGSALVEILACRLFDAKPLSKPMLEYFSEIVIKIKHFSFHGNVFENVVCQNGSHFVQGEMS